MDQNERADLVRAIRVEIKQRRDRPERARTSTEENDRRAERWLRTVDRRSPNLPRDATPERVGAHRQAVGAYQADRDRRGGFAVGERLRQIMETGQGAPSNGSPARGQFMRRANARMAGAGVVIQSSANGQRTYLSNGGVRSGPTQSRSRVITPAMRLGQTIRSPSGASTRIPGIGELSRRRHISPGMAPPAPGEPGFAEEVARNRRRADQVRRRRTWGF